MQGISFFTDGCEYWYASLSYVAGSTPVTGDSLLLLASMRSRILSLKETYYLLRKPLVVSFLFASDQHNIYHRHTTFRLSICCVLAIVYRMAESLARTIG